MSSPKEIASAWLAGFSDHIQAGDVPGTVSMFLPHGWLRDVLVFTWDTRSLAGHNAISSYLSTSLPSRSISSIKLSDDRALQPAEDFPAPGIKVISAGFTFETNIALGRGYVRLQPDKQGDWKAMTVFVTVEALKSSGPSGPDLGLYGGHTVPWDQVREKERAKNESDPYALIGQSLFFFAFSTSETEPALLMGFISGCRPDRSERLSSFQEHGYFNFVYLTK